MHWSEPRKDAEGKGTRHDGASCLLSYSIAIAEVSIGLQLAVALQALVAKAIECILIAASSVATKTENRPGFASLIGLSVSPWDATE
jgi:hypothetical protein